MAQALRETLTREAPRSLEFSSEGLDSARHAHLARRPHPQTRTDYVVGGAAEYDLRWKRRIQPLLAQLPGENRELEFVYSDCPFCKLGGSDI